MTPSYLGRDAMFEILTRTSLQTLDSCKVVCKEWWNIIHESNFMQIYCQRTKNLSGYYMQGKVPQRYFSKFISMNREFVLESLPEDTKILASSRQGILCCVRKTEIKYPMERFYVCKPSTKQWQVMPNPKMRYRTMTVGLMVLSSSPLQYKIVRISYPTKRPPAHHHYWVEIFDSTKWAWKAKPLYLPENLVYEANTVVTARSMYWIIGFNHVLAFDGARESFSTISLPRCARGWHIQKELIEYEGKLGCMVQQSEKCLEVWVVENFQNGSWKLEKIVKIDSTFHEKIGFSIPIGFYNADIAFMKNDSKVMFYKSQDHSYEEIKLDGVPNAGQCFPFRSDFEPVDLKGR